MSEYIAVGSTYSLPSMFPDEVKDGDSIYFELPNDFPRLDGEVETLHLEENPLAGRGLYVQKAWTEIMPATESACLTYRAQSQRFYISGSGILALRRDSIQPSSSRLDLVGIPQLKLTLLKR